MSKTIIVSQVARSATTAAEAASARPPIRDIVRSGSQSAALFAREAALIGAAVGAVTEAVTSSKKLKDGEISKTKYVGRVLNKASNSGSTTAARAVAAYTLRETAKSIAQRIGSETMRRIVSAGPATAVAFGGVNQIMDTAALARKKIDKTEYGQRAVQNVGATSGSIGGAAVGAAVGSVVPGPGTAIGAVIGGIAGGMAGSVGGRRAGEKLFKRGVEAELEEVEDTTE